MSLVLAPGQALYLTTGTPVANQALAMASFAIPGGSPNSALVAGTGATPVMLAQAVYGAAPTVISSLQVFNPDTGALAVKLTVQSGTGAPITVYDNPAVPVNGMVSYEGGGGWQLLGSGIPEELPQFAPVTANQVLAGPSSGSATLPAFRGIVNADLPLSGVAAGTYGSATESAELTVNAEGIVTGVAQVPIAFPTTLPPDGSAGGSLSGAYPNPVLGYPSMRNLLINAAQLINQRGYVSGTATTIANQYTLDRWKVLTSGQNVSWTVDANGIPTFTVPAGGWAQVIEGANLYGGAYVLSWTGTATATINGTAVAKGGTVNLAGGANATVVFSNGTLSLPQLELGSVTTVFDFRPAACEMQLCHRYFTKSYLYADAPGTATTAGIVDYFAPAATTGQINVPVYFGTPMRAIPAIVTYDLAGASGMLFRGSNGHVGSSIFASEYGTNVYNNDGTNTQELAFHFIADAEL